MERLTTTHNQLPITFNRSKCVKINTWATTHGDDNIGCIKQTVMKLIGLVNCKISHYESVHASVARGQTFRYPLSPPSLSDK